MKQLAIFCLFSLFCFTQTYTQEVPLGPRKIHQLGNKHAKASLAEYRDFLSISNDANIPEQLEPNMKWAEAAFQKRGFSTKRLPTRGLELILAERKVEGEAKTVLFYVQIDGQPVDPSKWFQPTPFTPVLKKQDTQGNWTPVDWKALNGEIDMDWRIFARSTSDAKGPINMFLAAIDAIKEAGVNPNYNIKVIMDCEEELGSPNLPAAVKVHKEALAADMLVILDGPMHPSSRPTLVFGARGIATMRLTTYGPKFPQHSGHYGNYVPNPALRLSQLLASMKDDDGRVIIPGFYDGISIDDKTRSILEQVPDDEDALKTKIGFSEADKVGNNLQEAIQYPSLNIRGMASAWVGAKVRTIIPSAAVANLDIRLVKESDPNRLLQLIRDHIQAQGFHIIKGNEPTDEERAEHKKLISISDKVSYTAFRTEFDTPIGQWLDAALSHTFGESPIKIRTHGGSVPISPFVNTLNVPAVAVPLVNSDNNQHSPNENLRLGNYFEGVKTCIGLLVQPLK